MARKQIAQALVPLASFLATLALGQLGASAQATLTTTTVASGFSSPLWVGAPEGDGRLFVAEQNSMLIKVVVNGVVQATPFLDLSGAGNSSGNERGLLGMTFHPNYADNGFFYVNYTRFGGTGRTIVERYTVSADPNVADASSAKEILNVNQPFTNHNAGALAFGKDGYLYIGLGDGGDANDPGCRAQNPDVVLGKMLRVDVDVEPNAFLVPADNPFVGLAGYKASIWALGLRNPWRYGFDRLTGDLYIGDVGQNAREEIDFQPAGVGGQNYGWKQMEGIACNQIGGCAAFNIPPCNDNQLTDPILDYLQSGGGGCTVVGGYVYRGCAMPDWQGVYFHADYCNGKVRTFRQVGGVAIDQLEITGMLGSPAGQAGRIVSFGEDGFGELLIVDHIGGKVVQVVPGTPVAAESLCASGHWMSIAQGGTKHLRVQPGAAFANQLYWVLGSATGTSPGITAGAFTLPLNFDNYLLFTINTANGGIPLVNTLNFLDASGVATAQFFAPPAAFGPSLAGITLNHAAVVLTGAGATLAVTNAKPLALTL